jgi:hypothetical protein
MTRQEKENMTTNRLLDDTIESLEILLGWAETDHQHALECGYKEQATDDEIRIKQLTKALYLLKNAHK